MTCTITADEVEAFHATLSNWGRWGDSDQLGALNLITPGRRAAAAASVRSGVAVGCARPLPTTPEAQNPTPVVHLMTRTHSEGSGGDYIALAPHGMATSHLDALCHIFHGDSLFNGYPTTAVTAHGAEQLGIHALADGVAGRGVLLDIARSRGVTSLEPGDAIHVGDLTAAEEHHGVEVGAGDILLVRTGRWARYDQEPWDGRQLLAGLHACCLPWLHERGVAVLGCDGVSDVLPSQVRGNWLPVHGVAIPAMGVHLLDNLDLERLGAQCEAEGRNEFLLTIGPLVLRGGTASPVNPIALF
jgi:kynurenine formamidase